MHPLEGLEQLRVNRDVVLTIGVFDGVHLGHQHVVGGVVRRAREIGGLAIVMTFHPHPQLVLNPSLEPAYLTTLEERLALIAELGVDLCATLPFTPETARVTARQFVETLCRALRLRELYVGHDFALGHKRQGTIPVLREMGEELGFTVVAADAWQAEGSVISSTRIRQFVRDGDVAHAARLLGRAHEIPGRVIVGDRRGRTLGFPTANLAVDEQLLLPADGVYAVCATVDGQAIAGVCNIGGRPSFAGAARSFEVHLLDFAADLYGQSLTVRFVQRLRDEARFPSADALVAQIQADVARTREMLGVTATVGPSGGLCC